MMKLWASVALATSTLSLTHLAHADFIGVYASADYWDLKGSYNEAPRGANMNDYPALDWDKKAHAQFAVSFEHPVPLIPNARIRHVSIDTETEGKREFTNQSIYTTQLDNSDFILYYEILDNIVSVDVGLAAKRLDGDVTYTSPALIKNTLNISETLPMAYGSVGVSLPLTGLSAKAEVLATSYSDVKASDISAEIKYDFIDTLVVDVGAKVGYRLVDIELDKQQDFDTKFKFEGPYVGLEVHF